MKANVLFFRRREGAEQAWTRELWVYDLRTNKHFTLKRCLPPLAGQVVKTGLVPAV